MHGFLWNKERDDALRQYRADGLSFSEARNEINRRFGTNYSRNACIGRAKRLGLTQTPGEIAVARAKAAVRREEVKRERRENPQLEPYARARRHYRVIPESAAAPPMVPSSMPVGSLAFKTLHAIRTKQAADANEPAREADMRPLRCIEIEPKHLTIMDLTKHTCRWPYGGWPENKPITFCGHWCEKEVPYCEAHEALSCRQTHNVSEESRAIISAALARANGNVTRLGPFDASEITDFGA